MQATINIKPYYVRESSQAEYASLNKHNNILRHESQPDDPPIPLEEMILNLKNLPPFVDVKMWCAWDANRDEIIAQGNVALLRLEENKHLSQIDITVQPDYRKQGIGKQLLALVSEAAHADQRRLLLTSTFDRIPAGEAFMRRLGAQKGLEGHVNQLRMEELDPSMIHRWLERGTALGSEFELGLWEGPYPEDQLLAVTQLIELTNQQPFGDIEINDVHLTPEQVRQTEQQLFARGSQRWTFYVIDKSNGKFAGYTETVWNPNRPEILMQDMTGVFPEYRNKGLGRWLKAAMLNKVMGELPQVKYIRTGNADSNAAMLKINHELGFKPYMASIFWQIETDRILAYLRGDE